jgi:hypothetical protein
MAKHDAHADSLLKPQRNITLTEIRLTPKLTINKSLQITMKTLKNRMKNTFKEQISIYQKDQNSIIVLAYSCVGAAS